MNRAISIFSLFAAVLFLSGTFLAPVAARAATAPDSNCDFNAQLQALASAQADASLGILQAVRAELGIRRDLLTKSIACDQGALSARQDALQQLPDSVKAMPVYARVTALLDESAQYYGHERAKVPDLGIQGTKDVARAIASWRQSNYIPVVTLTDDLLLWSANQDFFTKVSARLGQVARVVAPLKLVDQSDAANKYQAAQADFQAAMDENNAAKDALNQEQAGDALNHIKASLQGLADTYKVFFDLENTLQKLIK